MRRAGLVVAEALAAVREARVARRHHRAARRGRGRGHRRPSARRPSFLGLPRVPGHAVRLGQRRGRARHPGRAGAGDGRRGVDRLRRDRRRVARRLGDHGRPRRRCDPTTSTSAATTERAHVGGHRRAGRRRSGSASWGRPSRTSSTPPRRPGSTVARRYGLVEEYVGHGIGTSMHQPPDVPELPQPAIAARGSARVCASPSSRWSCAGTRFTRGPGRRLDGRHRRRLTRVALGAHGRGPGGRHLGADGRGRWSAGARLARCDRRTARLRGAPLPVGRSDQVNLCPVVHKSPVSGRNARAVTGLSDTVLPGGDRSATGAPGARAV